MLHILHKSITRYGSQTALNFLPLQNWQWCKKPRERVLVTVAADVAKAHRRCLCRETDFGYLGCSAKPTPGDDPNKDTVWLNRVGTFGVASAALHFGRLAGAIGRFAGRAMLQEHAYQLLFADDLKWTAGGSCRYLTIWCFIFLSLAVGTPFSWHKFRGGISLDYVGFYCDYARFAVGISERRSAWFVEWVDAARRDQWIVAQRGFVEFLGGCRLPRRRWAGFDLSWRRSLPGLLCCQ